MGTSNPATLRALAAARAALTATADSTDTLADVLTESRRAANNSQLIVDELMGPATPAPDTDPDPEPASPDTDPEPTTPDPDA